MFYKEGEMMNATRSPVHKPYCARWDPGMELKSFHRCPAEGIEDMDLRKELITDGVQNR